jgi:hypothetical protein
LFGLSIGIPLACALIESAPPKESHPKKATQRKPPKESHLKKATSRGSCEGSRVDERTHLSKLPPMVESPNQEKTKAKEGECLFLQAINLTKLIIRQTQRNIKVLLGVGGQKNELESRIKPVS